MFKDFIFNTNQVKIIDEDFVIIRNNATFFYKANICQEIINIYRDKKLPVATNLALFYLKWSENMIGIFLGQ